MEHSWLERQNQRILRKQEILRGRLLGMRGASLGTRFGLGQSVRIIYPKCFRAGSEVTISEYSYLHCLSSKGVSVGDRTSFDRNLWLHCGGTDGDNEHGFFIIGSDSYVGCNAVIGAGGGITIGSHVMIGQCVNFHSENHIFADPEKLIDSQGVVYHGIIVEDDVWIGSKCTLLDGCIIHKGAVIGAGAVVTGSIPPYSIAVGVPARVVGRRGEGKYARRDLP